MIPSVLLPTMEALLKARRPFLLLGQPGSGKTQMLEQRIEDMGWEKLFWHAPSMMDGDTSIPMPDADKKWLVDMIRQDLQITRCRCSQPSRQMERNGSV